MQKYPFFLLLATLITLFYLLNLILIIPEQYFTFVAPLSRFYYPDTWRFINAYIIIMMVVSVAGVCRSCMEECHKGLYQLSGFPGVLDFLEST